MTLRAALLGAALLWPAASWAVERISLFALFHDQALLQVDDQRHRLRAGERSPEGVLLVSTDTAAEQAVIEVAGERRVLQLGLVYEGGGPAPAAVSLYADSRGHFHAQGSINGVPVRFLVDTGATVVALSGDLARQLGLDYRRGKAGMAMTAGGPVKMYSLHLARVKVGGIELLEVEAGVLEGAQPAAPLLGMSFLNRFDMNREGNRLELVQRY